VRVQSALERGDLLLQQVDLGLMTRGLELVERSQLGDGLDVELLEQAVDAVLGTDALLD
jgi:hypothetical protein